MRLALLFLVMQAAAPAQAIDDILQLKTHYEVGEPIEAICNCDPSPDTDTQILWDRDPGTKMLMGDASTKAHHWSTEGSEHWIEVILFQQKYQKLVVFVPDPAAPKDLTKLKTQEIKINIGQPLIVRDKKYYTYGKVGPPVPVPPKPDPTPVPPAPIPAGIRDILILRESALSTPATAAMIRNLRDTRSLPAKYIQDKKYNLFILDVDSLGEDGKPSPIVESYKPLITGKTLPVMVVLSPPPVIATGHAPRGPPSVVAVKELPPTATADDVVTILKGLGG